MHNVERQIALAILFHHLFDHRVRVVAPAALLITKCPERRQRHVACEFSVAAEDLLYGRTVEEVVIDLTALRAEPRSLLRGPSEIKITAVAVIKKDSISRAPVEAEIERHGLID